jgi:hypothetical protein
MRRAATEALSIAAALRRLRIRPSIGILGPIVARLGRDSGEAG